jgi:phosphonopyruvate decarboxylase
VIDADRFLAEAHERGFRLYTGVPCSYLKPFINRVIDSEILRYVGAANEGDAIAIAAGAQLGGTRAVALFQNSGLGNAVNPLTSLTNTFRIPILLITSLRGDPNGTPDEPQHGLMGPITCRMLELMGIRWEYLPVDDEMIPGALARACDHMDDTGKPYALVIRKGTVEAAELRSSPERRGCEPTAFARSPEATTRRWGMLRAVQSHMQPHDIVLATTGYTGRELYGLGDHENQFYLVGSMGCVSSLGLGLALTCPERRIVVVDGDGAALMRLSAFATIGYERPRNLLHILLDNGIHESTGGQSTVSHSIDFRSIAAGCGYPEVYSIATPDQLGAIVSRGTSGLQFVHVPILPGIEAKPPRPSITPAEVAERLRQHLSVGR